MGNVMPQNDAQMIDAARELLDKHERAVSTDEVKASESDIRAGIRDLLVGSGLVQRRGDPPGVGPNRFTDREGDYRGQAAHR